MAIKREKMDEIVPKIQLGIIIGYVAVYLLGSVRHLGKTMRKLTDIKKKARSMDFSSLIINKVKRLNLISI